MDALEHFISHYPVKYIRGDREKGFTSKKITKMFEGNDIQTYFTASKFTYHNKLVDVVIKTIRNAIGYRMISEDQLQKIVSYYNHTYHKTIDCTPLEMMQNKDFEDQYIRYCTQRLLEVKQRQEFEGLLSYERGNILLLHCDLSKTAQRDEKRRRFWDRVGEFVQYNHGNVVVRLLGSPINIGSTQYRVIDLPVYYTRLIAKNRDEIPSAYLNSYSII
jgi:hypothetical protein